MADIDAGTADPFVGTALRPPNICTVSVAVVPQVVTACACATITPCGPAVTAHVAITTTGDVLVTLASESVHEIALISCAGAGEGIAAKHDSSRRAVSALIGEYGCTPVIPRHIVRVGIHRKCYSKPILSIWRTHEYPG